MSYSSKISLSDPLTLLREYTIAKRPIELKGEHICFGNTAFDRSTFTAYRSRDVSKGFYAIDSLWFLSQNADRPHPEYIAKCQKEGIKPVTFQDRRNLLDFLTGKIETSAQVDIENAPLVQPILEDASRAAAEARDLESMSAEPDEDAEQITKQKEAARAQAAERAKVDAAELETAKAALSRILQGGDDDEMGDLQEGEADRELKREGKPKPMSAARAFLKTDFHKTKAIIKRERKLRSRKAVLLASTSSFPLVAQILDGFRKRNKTMLEHEDRAQHKSHSSGTHTQHQCPPTLTGTPSGTVPSSGTPSGTRGTLRTSSSGVQPTPSIRAPSRPTAQLSGHGSALSAAPSGSKEALIIVPTAITSLINMWNIGLFLKENKFVMPLEAKAANPMKEARTKIKHTFEDGSEGTFVAIDNPLKLSPSEWEQVVCVFVQGTNWQFKGWPHISQVELFTKVLGVHVRFSDEQPNQVVKAWSVTTLVLSKQTTKQHEVGVTTMNFWQALHKFLSCHKPYILSR
mmetsp:Transcript_66978/g.111249  ORF Transcript_66978/g.111249 Transcript_66978/m.111249 type:complete len:517 (-) Transcript_66978:373-1923(-)|eukprot:CAMPEP_0119314594 /NCGR_PEP_ID=MMETSP1333-20130426/33243_1 /TAXON_ID=418940 /ORGANISM="Scyphosphaera apsteinii, Strain RCC1455" /LENGTH=516 /DNA_ID=CAMNT_0007319737 /DNA_START=68 /DNA_END=1618 /DNA_ORIENTATION=+